MCCTDVTHFHLTTVMQPHAAAEEGSFGGIRTSDFRRQAPGESGETALLLGLSGRYIIAAYPERFLEMLKSYAAAIILLCAGALAGVADPAFAQDRRVPSSGAEVR